MDICIWLHQVSWEYLLHCQVRALGGLRSRVFSCAGALKYLCLLKFRNLCSDSRALDIRPLFWGAKVPKARHTCKYGWIQDFVKGKCRSSIWCFRGGCTPPLGRPPPHGWADHAMGEAAGTFCFQLPNQVRISPHSQHPLPFPRCYPRNGGRSKTALASFQPGCAGSQAQSGTATAMADSGRWVPPSQPAPRLAGNM